MPVLLTGCFLTPGAAGGSSTVSSQADALLPPLSGLVDFGTRGTQTTLDDVANGATVSLIDVASGNTLGTTLTGPTGAFTFSFGPGFRPRTDTPYYLEAIKGLATNAPGNPGVRVRTILVYHGGWTSLTYAHPGAPVYINVETTAVSVIVAYRPELNALSVIGHLSQGVPDVTIEPPTVSTLDPTGTGIDNAEFHTVAGLVSQSLTEDSDPLFRIRYNPVFRTYSLASQTGGGTGGGSTGGGRTGPELQGLSSYVGSAGMSITLYGRDFGPNVADNTVKFNGTAALVTSASPESLTVVVPAAATSGLVTVTTSLGTGNGLIFTVLNDLGGLVKPIAAPTLTDVSPKAILPGNTVTLTGTNFSATPQGNQIWLNGQMTTPSTASATSLSFQVPGGWQSGPIQVARASAPSNPLYLTIGAPLVVGANVPSAVPGSSVTLSGLNFVPDLTGNTVTFEGGTGTVATASATTLTVAIPPGAKPGPLTVTTAAGTSAPFLMGIIQQASGSFGLPGAATVSGMAPTRGPEGLGVTLTGTGFSPIPQGNVVRFGGVPATIVANSATRLDVIVPAGATTGPVTIDTPSGRLSAGVFTVYGPAVNSPSVQGVPMLTGLSPTMGLPGTVVTVTGTNFDPLFTNNAVSFNGVVAVPTDGTAERLTVQVPAGATAGNVTVTHSGGTSTAQPFFVIPGTTGAFAVEAAPTITAITPGHARVGVTVTLTGTNFWTLIGGDSVSFNGVTTPIATVSATSLTCAVPGGATSGPVVLSTPRGNATRAFIVDPEPFVLVGPPVLSALSRSVAPAGATLTLTGSNFDPVLSGNTVLFAGGTATPSIGTTTSLTVIVPAGAGTGPVRVQTSTGTSAGAAFTYVNTLGGTFTP